MDKILYWAQRGPFGLYMVAPSSGKTPFLVFAFAVGLHTNRRNRLVLAGKKTAWSDGKLGGKKGRPNICGVRKRLFDFERQWVKTGPDIAVLDFVS